MARIDLIDICATLGSRAGARAGRATAFSIQDLSLTVHDGETLVVLGPSGCGKTTLLKIIAGLIAPGSGTVRYDGVDVKDVPPGARRIGMVFQSYALYPHVVARTNVLSYFLFRKKTPELTAMARGSTTSSTGRPGRGYEATRRTPSPARGSAASAGCPP